jgi:hypothetical protein
MDERRRKDDLLQALAEAPPDDEPSSPAEFAGGGPLGTRGDGGLPARRSDRPR